MPLRLLEIFLPSSAGPTVAEAVRAEPLCNCLGIWQQQVSANATRVTILLSSGETEAVMDYLTKRFSGTDGFRIVLLPVEAAVPRPEPEPEPESPAPVSPEPPKLLRISREELYHDVTEMAKLSPVFLLLVTLSSIVAAFGLAKDNVIALTLRFVLLAALITIIVVARARSGG